MYTLTVVLSYWEKIITISLPCTELDLLGIYWNDLRQYSPSTVPSNMISYYKKNIPLHYVKFQKILILLPWKKFCLRLPTSLEIPITCKLHTFLYFLVLQNPLPPPPPENFKPFHGGSMDIFWNCIILSPSYSCWRASSKHNLDSQHCKL